MVTDTIPQSVTEKCCSRCDETKTVDKFIKNRNICKECSNSRKNELYNAFVVNIEVNQLCSDCNQTKSQASFVKNRIICKECNNNKRKNKYKNDDEHRAKLIQQASSFKHNKVVEKQKIKLAVIGEDNKKCSVCSTIKNKCHFRYNRLKCRNCERDNPVDKFKRNIRSRIYIALKKNKDMHTIKYLGSTSAEYLQWILTYNEKYTIDNHGKDWHIDHVIPLSKFNLDDVDEQLIAFNWRNTMPLTVKENLSKNSKIITQQIEQHLKYLTGYHTEKNIELPQKFIDLFAT